jgi:ATP-dependent Clp protease adaptor protein ClpS
LAVSDTATLDEPMVERRRKVRLQPRYNVVLINDDDHTVDYVIEMMHDLFNHPPEKGFQIAEEVHNEGRCVCLTTTFEHAELKVDQIHEYGPDPRLSRCDGSMSAELEAVE